MQSAGDPAVPTTTEPRTPITYLAIGAGTLVAAALLIITLAAVVGTEPEPATVRQALAVAILLLAGGGSWALSLHWHRVMYNLAEQRSAAHADAAEKLAAARHEEIRQDIRETGMLIHRTSARHQLEDMGIALEQMVDRLDRLVVMRKEADARATDLDRRIAELEIILMAVSSPNVYDLSAVRDAKMIQQQIDEGPQTN